MQLQSLASMVAGSQPNKDSSTLLPSRFNLAFIVELCPVTGRCLACMLLTVQ